MVLRPAARYAVVFSLFLVLSVGGWAGYQLYSLKNSLEDFEYTPRPGSAQHDELEATLGVDDSVVLAPGGLLGTASSDVPEAGELPPWTWTSEPSPNHTTACAGEWKAGCEPPRWCDGTHSAVSLEDKTGEASKPRVELTITRITGMELESRRECTISVPTAEAIRFQHDESSVIVFGKTGQSLLTWQFDLACELVTTRSQSVPFQPAHTNDTEWFLRVVDQSSHEIVLADREQHGGGSLTAFYFTDGGVGIVIEGDGDAHAPTETRAYDLPAGGGGPR